VDRFAEFVELLDRLLTNDRTTFEGEYYSAVDARSTPGCVQQPRVPFVVAANGPRSIAVAARFGQGWITTGDKTDDLEAWWRSVGEKAERFSAALADAGRASDDAHRYLLLDSAPRYSLSSVDAFAEAYERARELGFTDAITHWPRPSSWYAGDESVLDEVASTVLASRGD
jgi:alkanesulfonate monooxygenase SsuD/methylene tetrahydromethanopterin reductase-like flavin-dependent oxidoreductase (luciferase family)